MHSGFVKLRRGLEEHLETDKLSYLEVGLYVRLMMRANYETGVVYVTTKELSSTHNSPEQIRKILDRLEEKKYIKTFRRRGSKSRFAVLINRHCRFHDGSMLNAFESTSPEDLVWVSGDDKAISGRSGGEDGSISKAQVVENNEVDLGQEVRSKNLEEIKEKEDVTMNVKNTIIDKSREILGIRIDPRDNNWTEIKALVRSYGNDAVVDKFEQWAKTLPAAPNFPLSGFIRIADSLLMGKFSNSVSPDEVSNLVKDLSNTSSGRVVFNNKQQTLLSGLLVNHSPADIKAAFSEFWGNISGDDFLVRQAAKTFTEAAEQLLYVRAKRVEDARKQAELIRACTENEVAKAAEEARKALKPKLRNKTLWKIRCSDKNIA